MVTQYICLVTRLCLIVVCFTLLPVFSALAQDSDSDTLPDSWELSNARDPNVPDYLINAGWHTSCGLDESSVSCWGTTSSGQNSSIPSFTDLQQLAVGSAHVCGLDANGVQCWGDNSLGQTSVPVMTGVSQIASFNNHTCAVHSGGVSCWGDNGSGQTTVPALTNPARIGVGRSHSCALDDNGVTCWGLNANGQTTVPVLTNPTDVTGGDRNTCAIHNGGEVACWGLAGAGQSSPPAMTDAIAISAGQNTACALRDNGSSTYITCWGSNGAGQGSPPALDNPVQITSGYQHNCALDNEGIKCWGRNTEGQTNTASLAFDSDGDTVDNSTDNCYIDANLSQIDTDSDGHGDVCDDNDDNDGYLDIVDSNPLDDTLPDLVHFTAYGDSASDYLGQSVAGAGDVNLDGYADVIVGSYGDNSATGKAQVLSGIDGSVLYTFTGEQSSARFGYAVSGAGDVNNDGYADVIVGAYQQDYFGVYDDSGRVYVYSGADGSLLYSFDGDNTDDYLGYAVAGAGDVNGDGYDDVIAGAYGDDNNGSTSGSARVYSGANGSVLYTFNGDNFSDRFGLSVSGAGDVNNDGYSDVVVGIREALYNSERPGGARVFSGVDGAILHTFYGIKDGDDFGVSVSTAGDVNQDGYADVIVGAEADDSVASSAGRAVVYSGSDGSVIYEFLGGDSNDNFGSSVAGGEDINFDGYPDLIVGSRYDEYTFSYAGSMSIFSGADGSRLYIMGGDDASEELGTSVAIVGDMTPNGFGVVAGSRLDATNGSAAGSAVVYELKVDADMDGMHDGWETSNGLDNTSAADAALNNDADSLNNLAEFELRTNPGNADTDSDGVNDDLDPFPVDPLESADTDGDGVGDNADSDDDGDGMPDTWEDTYGLDSKNAADAATSADADSLSNLEEFNAGTDPTDVDTDSDTVNDDVDAFPLDQNESVDTDGDGTGNNADTDDDNDGMPDSWENQYGFNPLVDDSAGDPDSDGVSNLDEYLAGTNPLVSNTGAQGVSDFNADGDDDLVFQVPLGDVTLWQMENGLKSSSVWLGDSDYDMFAIADTDGDADHDLVFVNSSETVYLWEMQDGTRESLTVIASLPYFDVGASGNLDGDQDDDLVVEYQDGNFLTMIMENNVRQTSIWLGAWSGQELAVMADVDGDGDDDIVTQDTSGNVNVIEIENGNKVTARWIGVWAGRTVVGAGDADNDGDDDIFMENAGDVMVIEMENGVKVTGRWLGIWSGTEVLAVGDIDNDGDADLIQQNSSTGSVQVVEIENGAKVTGRWLGTFAYTVKGVIDADADGDVDVVLQDGSGNVALIELENGAKVGGAKWLGVNSGELRLF